MSYNPYDLINLVLNGKPTYGRPFEFDSDATDRKNMKNAFGNYMKPKAISTTCPGCGQGLIIQVNLPDPPFPPFVCQCIYCHPVALYMPDPFINPVESGLVEEHELDPMLVNINEPSVISDANTTVAERIAESVMVEVAQEVVPSVSETLTKVKTDIKESSKNKPPKNKKTNAKDKPKDNSFVNNQQSESKRKLEAADNIGGEEVDFDDNDMVE